MGSIHMDETDKEGIQLDLANTYYVVAVGDDCQARRDLLGELLLLEMPWKDEEAVPDVDDIHTCIHCQHEVGGNQIGPHHVEHELHYLVMA
mmetsp:Transcript_1000/g.1747  ORF Transcript_1000/g.1747 Transcript_1000/m.1747 type:complete len:91 (-) Transcript_1000:731-1003(-)